MLEFYSKMVYETWKKRNESDKLIYIFSSSSFAQAYARYKYFEQVQDYSKRQIQLIEQTNDSLTAINRELSKLIILKSETQSKITFQNNQLIRQQNEANTYIADLKKKEKELLRKLNIEIKNRERFKKELEKLIAAQAKKSGSKNSTYKLTPEEKYSIRWHMGYTEPKELYNTIGAAYKKYPLALLMHEADLEATYFYDI